MTAEKKPSPGRILIVDDEAAARAALAELLRGRWSSAVVLGDFNTPRRAASFAPLRRTHRSAFDAAGRGWAPTWPDPVPLLDLDHAWLPAAVEPSCATRVSWAGTDHRPVVVELVSRARPG